MAECQENVILDKNQVKSTVNRTVYLSIFTPANKIIT